TICNCQQSQFTHNTRAREHFPTAGQHHPAGAWCLPLFSARSNTMTTINEAQMSDAELEAEFGPSIFITATAVPEAERMQFLPRFFGHQYMMLGETMVYSWMERLAPDYHGGFWNFYTLSNDAY